MENLESLIRQSISEEQKAVADYLDRKLLCEKLLEQEVDVEKQKQLQLLAYTFDDLLKEEKVHIGQLKAMLDAIGVEFTKELEGEQEGNEHSLAFGTFKQVTDEIDSLL